jgi:hypothetical protein
LSEPRAKQRPRPFDWGQLGIRVTAVGSNEICDRLFNRGAAAAAGPARFQMSTNLSGAPRGQFTIGSLEQILVGNMRIVTCHNLYKVRQRFSAFASRAKERPSDSDTAPNEIPKV